MAENQGSVQNKLGELFVEFGNKGLPGLLKGLNTVSASFLLGKNAANQFMQTLTAIPKEGAKSATEIGKMSNALATSSKEYQKLAMYLKSKNASEGLINDIAKVQAALYDWQTGFGPAPTGLIEGLNEIGLVASDYFGDFEDTLRLWEDMREATRGLDKNFRNQVLRKSDLSSEWGYVWDRGDFNLRDSALISDEALEKNIKAGESMAELAIVTENLKFELVSKIAPALITIANWITGHTIDVKETVDETERNRVRKNATVVTTGALAGGAIGFGLGGPLGAVAGASIGGGGGLYVLPYIKKAEAFLSPQKNALDLLFNSQINPEDFPYQLSQPISPPDLYDDNIPENPPPISSLSMGGSGFIPPNLSTSNITNFIEVNNNNTINGDNAAEVADKIAAMSPGDIQYRQFEVQNTPIG